MEKKIILAVFVKYFFLLALLFALSGRLDYWQGWVFTIIMVVYSIIMLYVFRKKMDLFKERLHPGKGVKLWDKIIMIILAILVTVSLVVSILDTGRYNWSRELPMYLYIINLIFFLASISFLTWAMYVNNWFSSMVRIQKDRKHKVCMDGPYRFVRHPGYAASLIMFITMPCTFGSFYGFLAVLPLIPLTIVRTYLEDKTLKKELKGYKEFTKKTKYRLFPGIW